MSKTAQSRRIGHIQLWVRRLLIIHGRMTTSELAKRIYARTTLREWHLWNVRRAARKFCVPVGRRRSAGLPVLWQLREAEK
jgi:hypothetical protein